MEDRCSRNWLFVTQITIVFFSSSPSNYTLNILLPMWFGGGTDPTHSSNGRLWLAPINLSILPLVAVTNLDLVKWFVSGRWEIPGPGYVLRGVGTDIFCSIDFLGYRCRVCNWGSRFVMRVQLALLSGWWGHVHSVGSDAEANPMGGGAKRQKEDETPGVLGDNVWAAEQQASLKAHLNLNGLLKPCALSFKPFAFKNSHQIPVVSLTVCSE